MENKDRLLFWLFNRITEEGINGRTGKTPDSCYSYWTYARLCILRKGDLTNKIVIREFLLRCQC